MKLTEPIYPREASLADTTCATTEAPGVSGGGSRSMSRAAGDTDRRRRAACGLTFDESESTHYQLLSGHDSTGTPERCHLAGADYVAASRDNPATTSSLGLDASDQRAVSECRGGMWWKRPRDLPTRASLQGTTSAVLTSRD